MPRLHHTVERFFAKLREVEVALTMGQSVAHVCRALSITEQTCNRWHNEYGSLDVDQTKRLKELEPGNTHVKRVVAISLARNARHSEMLHV